MPTAPDIKVDKSRDYKVNAGRCNNCGFYKTWEFRVKNPKSGKMMPGHVTEDGHKIDNGECPYWTEIKGAHAKAEKEVRKVLDLDEPAKTGTVLKRGFHHPHSYRGYYDRLGVEWTGDITIGTMIYTLRGAIGETYQGWKGGDYTMDESTEVHACKERGYTGEPVTPWMLECLVRGITPAWHPVLRPV
jgi:hypothetical protein